MNKIKPPQKSQRMLFLENQLHEAMDQYKDHHTFTNRKRLEEARDRYVIEIYKNDRINRNGTVN